MNKLILVFIFLFVNCILFGQSDIKNKASSKKVKTETSKEKKPVGKMDIKNRSSKVEESTSQTTHKSNKSSQTKSKKSTTSVAIKKSPNVKSKVETSKTQIPVSKIAGKEVVQKSKNKPTSTSKVNTNKSHVEKNTNAKNTKTQKTKVKNGAAKKRTSEQVKVKEKKQNDVNKGDGTSKPTPGIENLKPLGYENEREIKVKPTDTKDKEDSRESRSSYEEKESTLKKLKPTSGNDSATQNSIDKIIGKDSKGRKIFQGEKDGQYYLNEKGDKTYLIDDEMIKK